MAFRMTPTLFCLVVIFVLCSTNALLVQPFLAIQIKSRPTISRRTAHSDDAQQGEPHRLVNNNNNNNNNNNKKSLRWVIQAIERNDNNEGKPPSPELLQILKELENARTQKQVMQVGRKLESLPIQEQESIFVQERLIKVTAITGLMTISLTLLEGMLEKGYFPSEIAYTAVCKGLRQSRRLSALKAILQRLGEAAKVSSKSSSTICVVAFNTFLSALCDSVTKQDDKRRRNLSIADIGQLEKARKLLIPGNAYKTFRVHPDEYSYATVLHAAASVGNRAMVNEVWNEMKHEGMTPNRYAFNALMKAICSEGPQFDEEAIDLLDKMRRDPFLQPDQYTIDLVLLPVIRVEGIGRACDLIGDFVSHARSQPAHVLDQAFSSFLNTLIMAEEIGAARKVFDIFLLPCLEQPSDRSSSKPRYPSVRHFNILFGGLRKAIERLKSPVERDELRKESTKLFQTMMRAHIRPDVYTLTILMCTADSSKEVLELLQTTVIERDVNVSPEVLRATMAAFGRVNDPSSACWLFDSFRDEINDIKTWNALIGALTVSATLDSYRPLNIQSSQASAALSHEFTVAGQLEQSRASLSFLEGKCCPEAAMSILKSINNEKQDETSIESPTPNAQTYCLVAAALQHGESEPAIAMELFKNAMKAGIPADGRFVNAVLRCFGSDIAGALEAWKGTMRSYCLKAMELSTSQSKRSTARNLLAAYQGLIYVCGRALRPDIALRIVYAMNKDGVEVNEMALQCFQSGKRKALAGTDGDNAPGRKQVAFGEQFEALLQVECTKYETNDKRREGDKRVRIIL